MALNWSESYLIHALRILMPFFRKLGFCLSEIEFDGKDGDYLVFSKRKIFKTNKIKVIYNPGFDVIYNKTSLVQLKNKYPKFSSLPNNYYGEKGLQDILKGYISFIECLFKNKKFA